MDRQIQLSNDSQKSIESRSINNASSCTSRTEDFDAANQARSQIRDASRSMESNGILPGLQIGDLQETKRNSWQQAHEFNRRTQNGDNSDQELRQRNQPGLPRPSTDDRLNQQTPRFQNGGNDQEPRHRIQPGSPRRSTDGRTDDRLHQQTYNSEVNNNRSDRSEYSDRSEFSDKQTFTGRGRSYYDDFAKYKDLRGAGNSESDLGASGQEKVPAEALKRLREFSDSLEDLQQSIDLENRKHH